jgi:hypothetical protein
VLELPSVSVPVDASLVVVWVPASGPLLLDELLPLSLPSLPSPPPLHPDAPPMTDRMKVMNLQRPA